MSGCDEVMNSRRTDKRTLLILARSRSGNKKVPKRILENETQFTRASVLLEIANQVVQRRKLPQVVLVNAL